MTTEEVKKQSKTPFKSKTPDKSQTKSEIGVFHEYGEDDHECTFRPKINAISRSMATYLQPLHTEEAISFYLERKTRNLNVLREKLEKDQQIKCPECAHNLYGPKTKYVRKHDHEDLPYERLYKVGMNMVERKRQKIDQYVKEEYSFNPNSEKEGVEDRSISNFLKRNEVDVRRRELKLKQVMLCEKEDANPNITNIAAKKLHAKTNNSKPNIGADLYERGIKLYKEQAEKAKRPRTPPPLNQKTKDANERYYKKLMSRRFEDIFFVLDGHKTGLISPKNISLESLNPSLIKVMAEMLYEIEDFELTLDISQFVRACKNLFEVGLDDIRV